MGSASDCYAFTVQYDHVVDRLKTDIVVVYKGQKIKTSALWDTGATGSCISKSLVKNLSMVAEGSIMIHTPSGSSMVGTYLVDLILPNSVTIAGVRVCDSEIDQQGLDVLIGMDIIKIGDFTVSSYCRKTTFSFRFPSQSYIDYARKAACSSKVGQTHGKGKRKKKKR